jgi:hypothetical protein
MTIVNSTGKAIAVPSEAPCQPRIALTAKMTGNASTHSTNEARRALKIVAFACTQSMSTAEFLFTAFAPTEKWPI